MVEANRNDRYRRSLDDLFEAAMKREQKAGARDAPLGENANDVALCQRFAGSSQRLHDGPRPGSAVDGNDVAQRNSQRKNGTPK